MTTPYRNIGFESLIEAKTGTNRQSEPQQRVGRPSHQDAPQSYLPAENVPATTRRVDSPPRKPAVDESVAISECVILGERHNLQTETLRYVLPGWGIGPIDCGVGLRNLTETLSTYPESALLLVQPTRGLLTALREQASFVNRRQLVIVTPHTPSRFYLRDSLKVNPGALMTSASPLAVLLESFKAVNEGRRFIGPNLRDELSIDSRGQIKLAERTDLLALTGRQLEVVRLTSIGCSTKDVAERLGLSTKTIESHRYRAMQKLNVHDRIELTRIALSEGLLR